MMLLWCKYFIEDYEISYYQEIESSIKKIRSLMKLA